MEKEIRIPSCLGQMPKWHCQYCSAECTLTALCALLTMGDYLKRERKVPPFQDSSD